jgi:hypothetical protein
MSSPLGTQPLGRTGRRDSLQKNFVYSLSQYEEIVGARITKLNRIALVGLCRSTNADLNWGAGIEVLLVPSFIQIIAKDLAKKDPLRDIVPEGFPRLRAMQLALVYGAN